jgi:hypothetical protein
MPSLRKVCPARILHHFPLSYSHGRGKALAQSEETTSKVVGRASTQTYPIAEQYLEAMWREIRRQYKADDLFRGAFIFINAKNLKLHNQGDTFQEAQDIIDYQMQQHLNVEHLDLSQTVIDVSREDVSKNGHSTIKHHCSIDPSMAERQGTHAIEVPSALAHLIAINVEYEVLLCLGHGCRKAVSRIGILEHLQKIHKTTPKIRKQVQEFIQEIPWEYDYSTVPLPKDRLALQPIIPIEDGCQCRQCPFCSTSRKWIKMHKNKKHAMKRVADDELFQVVQLQTWFCNGKERYWTVDKSKQVAQDRRACRAAIQDVGEESDESEAHNDDNPDNSDSQEEIDNQIEADIEK